MNLGGMLISISLLVGGLTEAQEVVKGTVTKKDVPLKTNYAITGESTTVTTTTEKDKKYESEKLNFLFPVFSKALQNTAFVTSVTQTKGDVTSETNQWWDYVLHKKKSHAFVNLAFASNITLLFELQEEYRKCTKQPLADSEAMPCSLQTTLTVKGPLAVYGNFATAVNIDALLRNKQELEITLGQSWSGESTLVSKFNVKSVSFDESLARFFRIFNIPVFTASNDVGLGSELMDKISPLTSRQKLMLGVSRITRQAHERMLNL